MNPLFIGSGVALVTPFDRDGKINTDLFEKLIEFQIANNTDAVVVCGTTGEGSTLTVDERLDLFERSKSIIKGRVPLICGTGSNSTSFTFELAKSAEFCGADAHLMVTPYYNKTSQKGLIEHYTNLADNLEKPIIIYNVPTRTGMNIKPETYFELSKHKKIVAVKEADSNISKLIKSIVLCGDNLDFYSGNDDLTSVACSLGCKGTISVLSNILPKYNHQMIMYGLDGNCERCSSMQKKVSGLIESLFIDVNPIPVKYAMNEIGIDVGKCRMPLTELNEHDKKIIGFELCKHFEEIQSQIDMKKLSCLI